MLARFKRAVPRWRGPTCRRITVQPSCPAVQYPDPEQGARGLRPALPLYQLIQEKGKEASVTVTITAVAAQLTWLYITGELSQLAGRV